MSVTNPKYLDDINPASQLTAGATPQSTKKVKKESSEDDEVMGGQI